MRTGQRGRMAEDRACDYLQAQGLKLLQRNYRTRRGEIDLILQDADTLVFVEVRYRLQDAFGSAVESVDRRKQSRLTACALHYLQALPNRRQISCRFDVLAISGPDNRIEWIRNAFGAGE